MKQDRDQLAEHEAAAQWYLRRQAPDWNTADEAAFVIWRDSDTHHARLYAQLELSRPLHFGDYGGLPLKLLWMVLDLITIAVLVSGVQMWIARHRKHPH
jgi:uncharacterized iron-regulated membrane protein